MIKHNPFTGMPQIKFDYIVVILLLPLVIVSHFLIAEISPFLGQKHLIYVALGFVALAICMFFPIRKFTWMIPFAYWINIALLVLVQLVGSSKLGAQRWIEIPLVGFTIQPSELIKPFFVLMLAYLINENPPPKEGYGFKKFMHISFYIVLPFVLIVFQPDLGTASIMLILGFGILFLVGIERKLLVSLTVLAALAVPIYYTQFMQNYQKKRVEDFLSQEPSYHVKQSIIAIGNGGLTGKSKANATQGNFKFLPIASSDFIFAYFIERFGFIGAVALMLIYLLLILHIFSMQYLLKGDYFLIVFSLGVSILFFVYVAINIAMIIGLFPVVGVPLPLFSYGGSSFFTFMIMLGILENLLAFRLVFMYNYA